MLKYLERSTSKLKSYGVSGKGSAADPQGV